MFRSLKLKLMLLNVAVIVLISAFLMTGIYFLMVRGNSEQAEEFMTLIAADANSAKTGNITQSEKYSNNYFYVKINNSGEIIERSQNSPVSRAQCQVLVYLALKEQAQKGVITLDDESGDFRFLKAPLKNGEGSTLVFMSTGSEKLLIGHLMGAAALTLLCSLFMAKKALIPIQASWNRQRNFVADASHELRTPLSVIQTNLEIVMDNLNDTVESQKMWLENIQIECSLMSKLVEDLLFLARADSDQMVVNMACFNLNEAANEALIPFEPVAERHGLKLNKILGQEINFFGDQLRIKQLFAILIDNAIKYTPAGGEVSFKLQDTPDNVEIIVSDTGEGIEEDHLTKIFERFYRVDKARKRESGGSGLGLSIANLIVKEHKGSIKVKSNTGSGTTFTVSLPKSKKKVAFLLV